jgi:pSer/pThr/pTyr-binding forkhead associated (FHA) protein
MTMSSYVFCNQCGHRNPPDSSFCSSCGSPLDSLDDRTITLTAIDPLQDAPGSDDDVVVPVGELPTETGVLIVRAGAQAGARFVLNDEITRLGRHPDSEISLDDITVSRRHATIERTTDGYVLTDAGSLNGSYVNQERVERLLLRHGDELQIGKFRLVFFERNDG